VLQKFFWAAPPLLLAVTYSQPILAQTAEVKTSAPENMAGDGPKNAGVLQAPTDSRASYNVMLPSSKETNPSFEWINAPAEAPRALVEAISIVTKNDPAAQAAWLGARAALSDVRGARWQRYPSLTTDLGLTTGANSIAPSVIIELPLWTGGQISSSISRARKIEAASVARWHEAILNLALETSQYYWNIVLYSRLEQLTRDSLDEHQKLVASMQRRVDQEVSPAADLELAKSRTAQIEQELASVQAQNLSAMRNLAELVRDANYNLGFDPQFDVSILPRDWSDVATEVVQYSPARSRQILESDASRSEISIAKSGILPRVVAQHSYNEITGSRFGIGLRLQASNGLSQFSAVDSATARYAQSLDQVRLIERQLRQEVASEVQSLESSIQRAIASQAAAISAQRVSESYMRQFIAGRRSWLDVMNSLRESLGAQTGQAQAEVTAMAVSVRLKLRSGRWQPTRSSSKD
jgi:adhesin transport system outer membrane protein